MIIVEEDGKRLDSFLSDELENYITNKSKVLDNTDGTQKTETKYET